MKGGTAQEEELGWRWVTKWHKAYAYKLTEELSLTPWSTFDSLTKSRLGGLCCHCRYIKHIFIYLFYYYLHKKYVVKCSTFRKQKLGF